MSRLFTVDKRDLVEYIGTLKEERVRQLLDGIKLVLEPREPASPASGVADNLRGPAIIRADPQPRVETRG